MAPSLGHEESELLKNAKLATFHDGPLGLGLRFEPQVSGVVISSVEDGSQAAEAGVVVGDIVIGVEGAPTRNRDKATVLMMIKAASRPFEMRLIGPEEYEALEAEWASVEISAREDPPTAGKDKAGVLPSPSATDATSASFGTRWDKWHTVGRLSIRRAPRLRSDSAATGTCPATVKAREIAKRGMATHTRDSLSALSRDELIDIILGEDAMVKPRAGRLLTERLSSRASKAAEAGGAAP